MPERPTTLPPSKIGKMEIQWKCRIRELRDARGWTLRDLERITGVPNPTLSFVERGTNPTLDTAVKVATAFGLPVEQVWTRL